MMHNSELLLEEGYFLIRTIQISAVLLRSKIISLSLLPVCRCERTYMHIRLDGMFTSSIVNSFYQKFSSIDALKVSTSECEDGGKGGGKSVKYVICM